MQVTDSRGANKEFPKQTLNCILVAGKNKQNKQKKNHSLTYPSGKV